ncbi:MAG: cobyric acid synthase [Magnetovibrionaceae bacterium]
MAPTRPPALMIQGTGSDVGKSLLVAGLCRLFANRGLRVCPFKPQNMSNNAAVTADGGEIGRAQALQARAARLPLSVHMNPVLLKPQSEVGAQIVVQGQVFGTAKARDYQKLKPTLLAKVLESFETLGREADLILVEGAGSPAEVNLRAGDIANMGFAEAADIPVLLAGDIDRGGVIAQLVGTHALLTEAEKARVKGFLVNKFRGDVSLFDDGVRIIEERTGWPSLGVVPYFEPARSLPAEDAMAVDHYSSTGAEAAVKVAVAAYPRVSNFDDLDPLRAEPSVRLEMIRPDRPLPGDADLIILPGSKSTIADLAALREAGWDVDLLAHVRRGGRVIGICGGFQMLGKAVHDPEGIEGAAGTAQGLALLDVETWLEGKKALYEDQGVEIITGQAVRGYHMHMGRTTGAGLERPYLTLTQGPDGAVSADGRVVGGYLHGLFASDLYRRALLDGLQAGAGSGLDHDQVVEDTLDQLAEHLERVLKIDLLEQVVQPDGALA